MYILFVKNKTSTYGHSQLKTGHPVRSAIHKQLNGRLVLRWVTTWESLLLYVLHFVLHPRKPKTFEFKRHRSSSFLNEEKMLFYGFVFLVFLVGKLF
jgi:hypothetical protein